MNNATSHGQTAPPTAQVVAIIGRTELDYEVGDRVWTDTFCVDLVVVLTSSIDAQVKAAITNFFPGFELATWGFPRESAEDEF